MSPSRTPDTLNTLFADHDLKPARRGDWLVMDGVYPALRAQQSAGALSIDIAFDSDRVVTELYPAGDGLDLFRDGAFPVLLSAFWGRHDPNLILREVIRRPDGPWQLIIGRYLRTVDDGERQPLPYLLFGALRDFLTEAELSNDMHWLSAGVAVDADGPAADIRLDGIRQPELEAAIMALDWPYDGHDYTLRHTVLMTRL